MQSSAQARDDVTSGAERNKSFRQLLSSTELSFICEAHNGISAKIVQEAGFKGIWASGLSLSAQFGVRDNNEASWTQVLEMLEFMADATSIPIMLDGDTGYGNFNNMRRLVRKLEQRGVSAVCIEDKIFPKTNSFIDGSKQQLADIDEFCGKIKAGKEAQHDDQFSIVARVEAFIAGWGLDEALKRAEAYHQAGADAILMHSALRKPDEILAFMREWGDRCPVVIVPTKYYATPTDVFREHGVSMVIWANHLIRSSVKAMQETAQQIMAEETLRAVEDNIVPVSELFRLQGASELQEAEKRYLPEQASQTQALVLAASRGRALGDLTLDCPKAMIKIKGKSLLERQLDAFRANGIKNISVVRGYKKEAINFPGISFADNDDYENTGELWSLKKGLETVQDDKDLVVTYGDLIFNRFILQWLLSIDEKFAVPVDESWQKNSDTSRPRDLAVCSSSRNMLDPDARTILKDLGETVSEVGATGEWVGAVKISAAALPELRQVLDVILSEEGGKQAKMPDLLQRLIREGQEIQVLFTSGHWVDVDNVSDLINAEGL